MWTTLHKYYRYYVLNNYCKIRSLGCCFGDILKQKQKSNNIINNNNRHAPPTVYLTYPLMSFFLDQNSISFLKFVVFTGVRKSSPEISNMTSYEEFVMHNHFFNAQFAILILVC